MDRKYKSGAEKRKLKAEKKQNDENLLSKIPKLTSIFQVKNVDNDSNSSTGDQHADSTTEEKKLSSQDNPVQSTSTSEIAASETPAVPSTSTETSFSEIESDDTNILSNDPGFWPINQSNQSILQCIWLKKGNALFHFPYLKILN